MKENYTIHILNQLSEGCGFTQTIGRVFYKANAEKQI